MTRRASERRVGRLAGIFCFFTALGHEYMRFLLTSEGACMHAYILYATRLHPPWINHDAKTLGRGWRTTMRFVEHTPIVFIKRFVLNALFYFKRGAICAQQLGYVPLYERTERWEPLDLHSMMRRPRSKYLLNYSNQRPLRCAWDHIIVSICLHFPHSNKCISRRVSAYKFSCCGRLHAHWWAFPRH